MKTMRLTETDIINIISETVNLVLANKRIMEGLNADSGKVILYHGSPYKFDSFSMPKINTGQHSQDFGMGLYFTTDEETAKFYADELSNTMSLKDKFDMTVHSFTDDEGLFTGYLENGYSLLVKHMSNAIWRMGLVTQKSGKTFSISWERR